MIFQQQDPDRELRKPRMQFKVLTAPQKAGNPEMFDCSHSVRFPVATCSA